MAKADYWLDKDNLIRVQGWARDGLTDEQICQKIGIHVSTLCEWKNRFPQLSEAIKKGKAPAKDIITHARATIAKPSLAYKVVESFFLQIFVNKNPINHVIKAVIMKE